jgi:hypothetical protein
MAKAAPISEGATSLRPSFAEGFGRARQGYGMAGKIAPLRLGNTHRRGRE